ncbi:MAG: diadenylate cyclase CdaA [Limisphaerales bacterium]
MIETLQAGWRAVLEVLLLAVAIYYVLSFLRGTRAAPVLIGFLILLLVLFTLAAVLNLEVLGWMLGAGTAFIAFAALVIFQPEIRRLLARVGDLPLFASVREQRENLEVIVQSCARLSEVRIGALLAIERAINLQEVVEVGIRVDCEATPEMLETIFFPNNAIHDGGVIIRGDRIAFAACIFPLTQRSDLNKSVGTRHRAAIGLSEETDAILVVVSEETGAISYAHKGQFQRNVSLEELRLFLSSVFVRQSDSNPDSSLEQIKLFIPTWLRRKPADVQPPPPK